MKLAADGSVDHGRRRVVPEQPDVIRFTVVGAERWGCSTSRATGTGASTRTISTAQLEHHVLDALRHRLLQPDLVEAFVEENRSASEAPRKETAAAFAKVERTRGRSPGG